METTKQLIDRIQAFATQNDLKLSVRYANSCAKSFLQSYYLTKEKEIISKINNSEKERCFADYLTGYRARMEQWLREEGNIPVKDTSSFTDKPRRNMNSLILFVLGTIVSVMILVIGKHQFWWLAILLEIVFLFFSYRQHSLDSKKTGNVRGIERIIDDVQAWIETGESYSDSILKEYGIN